MKTLKDLLEDVRAFNLDTDEELDLDALADIDLDSLLGGDYIDPDSGADELAIDFGNIALDDEPLDPEDSFGPDDELSDDPNELDVDGENSDFDFGSIALDDEELDFGDETDEPDMGEEGLEDEEGMGEETPDADFQGEIRTVRGANLVFKRKTEDGNFEELWIYNVGNDIKRETQVRRAILAGTDVDPGSQESKDGSQRAESSTTGNVQFLHIIGLPQ